MRPGRAIARAAAAAFGMLAGAHAAAAEVRYLLWDASQLPAYRQCARDFEKNRPGTRIRLVQQGWGDYWTTLSMGFIAGAAPDVFTNHLRQYAAYAANGLIEDLAPWIRRDGVDLGRYAHGLAALWSRDGRQYGLPKDWDTVALVVNLAEAKKAGVTLAELQAMRWNPADGGSFEAIARRLTRDAGGRHPGEPGFDRKAVTVWGFQQPGPGGMMGQTEWSHFAVSDGFRFQDAPWDNRLHYDDPRLAETLGWLASLTPKGLSAPLETVRGLGAAAMFASGRAAIVPDGSWMSGYYAREAKFAHAWVPLPRGPSGRRATMVNGLADSIWSGSKVKEEAWQWVKYLGSADCQRVVAEFGVVFPAITGLAERAAAVQKARSGVDTSAFLQMAAEQTFLPPMADQAARVDAVIDGAIESVLLGRQDAAAALKAANAQVRTLLAGTPRR